MPPDIADIEVIAPNLKRRLSGVTATIARLVPVQAGMIGIVATGPGLPAGIPHIPLWRLFLLPRNRIRVWHARRNNEMLLGIVLRSVFRRKLALVFTSSSPRVRGRFTRWLLGHMDTIVATNALNASVMPADPKIIPHGVDTQYFHPGKSDLLGLSPALVAGCLGRIRPRKGTADFVTAVCALLPERPEWRAAIIGRVDDARYADGLKNQIAAAGLTDRVLFFGPIKVSETPEVYRSLSLVVTPSRLEGFGLTPIEAAACGIPTVASRGVGCFDAAVVAGETGDLADPGDALSFQNAMARFMDDDDYRRRAGSAARAHILMNFRIETEAAALVAVYRNLLDRGRR